MTASRQRWLKVVLVACAPACATSLPSETPLGSGPLARASAAPSPASRAPAASDAGATEAPVMASAPAAGSARDGSPEPADAGAPTTAAIPDAGAPEAGSRARFAGTYAGKDRAVIRMTGKPDQTEDDPKARISVAEAGNGALGITLVNSADGTPICTLNAKLSGDRADVAPGQPCFSSGPGATSTVQRGTATFAGSRLTVDLLIGMRVTAGGQNAAGTIDYHFEGTRE